MQRLLCRQLLKGWSPQKPSRGCLQVGLPVRSAACTQGKSTAAPEPRRRQRQIDLERKRHLPRSAPPHLAPQSCADPARDIFSGASELVASLVVIPVSSRGGVFAALYLALEAPCDFEALSSVLLVRLCVDARSCACACVCASA
jgi:hypothetical protein